jgi:hypothetical protein
MKKRNILVAAVAATASLALSGPAFADTLKLDAYDHDNGHFAGPVTSPVLTAGQYYVATVDGTISYYSPTMWTDPFAPFDAICGTTERRPSHSTPDRTNGRVGMDAETIFARPCFGPAGSKTPAVGRWRNFEINSTSTERQGPAFVNVVPLDGPYSTPTGTNTYKYPLVGQGVPAQFRLRDWPGTRDNYGQLWIDVRPATGSDCSGDKWRAWGFADGDECWYTIEVLSHSPVSDTR